MQSPLELGQLPTPPTHWQHHAWMGRRGKRPIDEDVEAAVLERVPKEGRADSSYKYLKRRQDYGPKRAYPWQDGCLLKYQSSAWLSSAAPRTVSIACDAKRLGCPAEDVEVFGAVVRIALGEEHFVWLPPQVPLHQIACICTCTAMHYDIVCCYSMSYTSRHDT